MDYFVLIADAILFIAIFLTCAVRGMITKKILLFMPFACAISFGITGLLSYAEQYFIGNSMSQYRHVANIFVFISTLLMAVLGYFCLIAYSKVVGACLSRQQKIIIPIIIGLSLPYCIAILVSVIPH